MELYNYKFLFKDSDGNLYKLRAEQLTACTVRYRAKGSVDSFTETLDFNLDESSDGIWVRLPALGTTEIVINLTIEPLRNVTTALIEVDLVPYTTTFTVVATPTPIYSLQGFSPRVIDGYWHEFDDLSQTYRNTGIRAQATIITEAEVVDYAEKDNQNAITSNAVWNIVNEQNITNVNINNHIDDLQRQIDTLGDDKVKVKVNGEVYEQDDFHVIDLGEIGGGSSLPATHMLERNTVIDGVIYPKGTEVDDDGKVYATDSYYRYQMNDKSINGKSYVALLSLNQGGSFNIKLKIYNNSYQGQFYVSKQGERGWTCTCTNADIASQFKLYFSSAVSSPILVRKASTGYYVGTIDITSDTNYPQYNLGIDIGADRLVDIKSFLTDYEKDTIEIDTTSYVAPDLHITDYIVTVGGEVDFTVQNGMASATDISFSITEPNTKINVIDGATLIESRELQPGEVATLIYSDPSNYYWTYTTYESLNIHDVLIDGTTCVVKQKAYIYSLTTAQMNTCLAVLAR